MCLVCIVIKNILVKVRGRILSKMWKDEVMGVDQLKDRASKFLGCSCIQVFRQTSRSSFSEEGESNAEQLS